MSTLQERIDRGEVIILDGATGTELEKRGVPMHGTAWSGAALKTHPEVVRQIHEDYIRAGADIIITNSFATAKHVLTQADLGDQFRELNRRAVTLAQEARNSVADRPIFIAGSISTFYAYDAPSHKPAIDQAHANYREQAEILVEAGVDLIMLEMMQDIEQATAAITAAASTGVPVWIGFSCQLGPEGTVFLWDREHLFAEVLDQLMPLGGVGLTIMHTLTEDIASALPVALDHWSGPIGIYAHSGKFIMPNWQFIDMISPEAYVTEAEKWVEMGVQIIGGCCGIGPEHIRALKEQLPTHIPADKK